MNKYLNQLKDVELIFNEKENKINWETKRKSGIGGSDIGIICGVSPYQSILELFDYKANGIKKSFDEVSKERMHFGNVLESIIADEFKKRNNVDLSEIGTLRSMAYDYCIANIDRLIIENEKVTGILECKTASENSRDEWLNDNIPVSYIYQLQWYMFITGVHTGYIAALIGGNTYYQKKIEYDADLIEIELLPKAYNFWHNHVLANKCPIPDGLKPTIDYINNKYKSVTYSSITFNSEFNSIAQKAIEVKTEIKKLEKKLDEYNNKLKFELKENNTGYTECFKIDWSLRKRSVIDSEKLKNDGIYEKYLKNTEYKVLTIKNI